MILIVCIPNPIANKTNSHFRGRMEIMASAIRDFSDVEVKVATSADQWTAMRESNVQKTFIHLGDSYGGPELGGWNWNEWGRLSEDDDSYKLWLRDIHNCWESLSLCGNPTALEFPFPDKFGHYSSMTFRHPKYREFAETRNPRFDADRLRSLYETVLSRFEEHRIYSNTDKTVRDFYDPWAMAVKNGYTGVCLGDSHGLSSWRPGYALIYRKGETLFGAIRRGFGNIIRDTFKEDVGKIKKYVFNYGNIDLRHHICRFSDVEKTVDSLISGYEQQIRLLKSNEVTVVSPFPINDDNRIISKSVMFSPKVLNDKGKEVNGTPKPFSGTWEQRTFAQRYMADRISEMCRLNGWECLKWPPHFTDKYGRFNPEVMESGNPGAVSGRGIHLSPQFYYWDVFNNRVNDYAFTHTQTVEDFFA